MTAGDGRTGGEGSANAFGDGFLFGVATAGYQVEGGFNGAGEPANNWLAWEQVGRVEPSGGAVGFWDRPEEALDRAAALGCTTFRFGVEWARVVPRDGAVDRAALDGYVAIARGCRERGLEPMVTLHHFTHPAWLGVDFWLRPDAPERFGRWAELALDALADDVRLWVTINEPNALAIGSWLLGMFPPGRIGALGDVAVAADHLLTAHVLGYEVIHHRRPDAVVTTNTVALSVYDLDRLHTDLLLARSAGIGRGDLDRWIDERRRQHDSLLPAGSIAERAARAVFAARSPYGGGAARRRERRGEESRRTRRAVDAVYESGAVRTLDVLGVDFYAPGVAAHVLAPGHRTAGGRTSRPTRPLWDDPPDPPGLARWLSVSHALAPDLPVWVVENGLCNRVRDGRSLSRVDGWNRPRYLREHLAAVADAIDGGTPVTGYLHWSLVDNYEWGSYEPRFGLFGVDRDRGADGYQWLETDSMGLDAAGAYRELVTRLRSGDRSVLAPGGAAG